MKTTFQIAVIAGILLLIACITRAAEPTLPIAPESTSYYGSELSADIFTGYGTTDFNDETGFTGFGVNYYLNETFGVGASTSFTDFSGHFFDNLALKGLYRIPLAHSKNAFYGFAGGLRELDADKWGITAGLGLEMRWAKYFATYLEIAIEKFDDIDPLAIGKIGVRIPLSLK